MTSHEAQRSSQHHLACFVFHALADRIFTVRINESRNVHFVMCLWSHICDCIIAIDRFLLLFVMDKGKTKITHVAVEKVIRTFLLALRAAFGCKRKHVASFGSALCRWASRAKLDCFCALGPRGPYDCFAPATTPKAIIFPPRCHFAVAMFFRFLAEMVETHCLITSALTARRAMPLSSIE
jgi:hypothetical protein